MIRRIKGKLVEKEENKVYLEVGGICYEINLPATVYSKLNTSIGEEVELRIYQYFHIEKNKSIPVMIGFIDEMEREFFEKFISVSGVGPKAALKAFDKPIPLIAQAIEEGDINFLSSLAGIGRQKARQIVASLQGKVGRFALLQQSFPSKKTEGIDKIKEAVSEAKQVLRRLGYKSYEIKSMIEKAIERKPDITSCEELLNQIYYQRRQT